MERRKEYIDEIKRLEKIVGQQGSDLVQRDVEIEELRAQLEEQGVEVQGMARASMEVREEDVAQLAQYRKFIEDIAASKSKFGKKARQILGI